MKTGIAITTTPSRAAIHKQQMVELARYTPEDVLIYVHNDKDGIGVARSKNNCLKRLYELGCDYLILLDDDVYPIRDGWITHFIESGLNHACPTFTSFANGRPTHHRLIKQADGIEYFSSACGMVLFYTRACVDAVGGMDIRYGKWGYEHTGYSQRIKNAGLIPMPFLSPKGSMDFFYSMDYHSTVTSTASGKERAWSAKHNRPIYDQELMSADWKPFRESDYVLMRNDKGKQLDMVRSEYTDTIVFSNKGRQSCVKQVFSPIPKKIHPNNFALLEYYEWILRNREYCNKVFLLLPPYDDLILKDVEIEQGSIYLLDSRRSVNELLSSSIHLRTRLRKEMPLNRTYSNRLIAGYCDDVLRMLSPIKRLLHSEDDRTELLINHAMAKYLKQGVD